MTARSIVRLFGIPFDTPTDQYRLEATQDRDAKLSVVHFTWLSIVGPSTCHRL